VTHWNRTEFEPTLLARSMLTVQKQHSRVEHSRDDDLIDEQLSSAISTVERRANINLHPATYRTLNYTQAQAMREGAWCWCESAHAYGYRLPFNNVTALRAYDADGTVIIDTEASGSTWTIAQQQFGANRDAYLVSTVADAWLPAAAALEIDCGTDAPEELDPAVVSVIRRMAASMYENREANIALSDSAFDSELIAIWRPCA